MPQLHPQAQGSSRFRWCGIRDGAYVEMEVPPTAVLIDWLVSGRITDAGAARAAGVAPIPACCSGYRRVRRDHGCASKRFMICFSAPSPDGSAMASRFIPPDTYERWPAALFVRPTSPRRLSTTP